MTTSSEVRRYRVDEKRLATSHVEGEAVVLDVRGGTYFSLNRSAGALWSVLTRGATHDELVGALVEPDAEPAVRQRVSRDVDAFLDSLRAEGMLEEQV
jgi:alpha-beta hydrolase superfamily lysophospholipase